MILVARFCLLMFALFWVFGISSRHDVDNSAIIVNDADYPAVVSLFGNDDCSATLIDKQVLVTVAHCAKELTGRETLSINGGRYAIKRVTIHDKWKKSEDDYDIALIRLKTAVSGVAPIPLYRSTVRVGDQLTLLGRGIITDGLRGEAGGSAGGQLRKATNRVKELDGQFIVFKFDRPASSDVTPLEGVGVSGDSGGPVFIAVNGKDYLVGMNSYGTGNDRSVGKYGKRDYQTRIDKFLGWIDNNL